MDFTSEDFLADFIPRIFLWIEFRRRDRQEQQRDVVGYHQVAAAMVGTSSRPQDVLPGDMSEASSSRSRTRVRARLAVSADSGRIVVGRIAFGPLSLPARTHKPRSQNSPMAAGHQLDRHSNVERGREMLDTRPKVTPGKEPPSPELS